MVVYHIVLLKLKCDVLKEDVHGFARTARDMVGQIPGLISVDSGHGLVSTLYRGKGYNYGVVAVLEKGDDVPVYAAHPSHLKTTEARLIISDDFLAFDLVGGN